MSRDRERECGERNENSTLRRTSAIYAKFCDTVRHFIYRNIFERTRGELFSLTLPRLWLLHKNNNNHDSEYLTVTFMVGGNGTHLH